MNKTEEMNAGLRGSLERGEGSGRGGYGLSETKRDFASVVVTTGVTSTHGGCLRSLRPPEKVSPPLNDIWTVTQVTQKLGYLLQSARVRRRSTGTGTRVCVGVRRTAGLEEKRQRNGWGAPVTFWKIRVFGKYVCGRSWGSERLETKCDSSKTNSGSPSPSVVSVIA